MKIFAMAFLAGLGYKTGEFVLDFLYTFIRKNKRKNSKVSYNHYYD